jgi:hypothetical protein
MFRIVAANAENLADGKMPAARKTSHPHGCISFFS